MTGRRVPALRQAMVRMLYDPAYVGAVLAGPVAGLTEAERALLLQVDPRGWSTDRFRRSRGVHALLDEYPVTAAILGIAAVDAFFSSAAFARCLSTRGSMALDFGPFAIGHGGGEITRLELALARARRQERAAGPGLCCRPGVEALTVSAAAHAAWLRIRAELGPDPVAALVAGKRWPHPGEDGPQENILIEVDAAGELSVGAASDGLVALLAFAAVPAPRLALEAEARRLGCDPGEDAELLDALLDEGLLIAR